jgi:hypothetical protein
MKQINLIKKFLFITLLWASGAANAQVHPLAFGSVLLGGTATTVTNWYADYVGLRVQVVTPAAIAGDKVYKSANDGNTSNTNNWGGFVTVPIVNVPIFMDSTIDSSGCTAFSPAAAATMNGKIAVIWRGPLSGPCDFGCKALNAQNAGAVAIILINEYPGQGPIGMAASTSCLGITIPVFMIGNLDGIAISGQYRAGIPVRMTITPWGQGLTNDLGFVPGGVAGWHSCAVPKSQLASNGNPFAYKGKDGAFVANYGSHLATHVKVSSTLSFTPTGGSATQLHTDTSGTLAAFPVLDSIYAMFAPSEYDLPTTAGTGRFDLVYHIIADTPDQYTYDNVSTYSFYATDSLYSKGRYDFSTNQPIRTIYESFNGGNEYLWGPTFYVANAGSSLSTVQYSLAMNVPAGGSNLLSGSNNVYLFKWVDGYVDSTNSITYPKDSIMENGELQLVSLGVKNYNNVTDTSDALLTLTTMADTNGNGSHPNLDAQTWYYLAVDVPSSTSVPLFLGADGILNPYPRVYGRFLQNPSVLDYSNVVEAGAESALWPIYNYGNTPTPATYTTNINSVDSFNYGQQNGLIPAVAMITGPLVVPNSVNNVPSKAFANVSLYPNPATDYLTVSVDLPSTARTVTYEVIDGFAKFVNKEVHYNVQSEKNVISTKNYASGNYFLIIRADDKIMSRKFTVLK